MVTNCELCKAQAEFVDEAVIDLANSGVYVEQIAHRSQYLCVAHARARSLVHTSRIKCLHNHVDDDSDACYMCGENANFKGYYVAPTDESEGG